MRCFEAQVDPERALPEPERLRRLNLPVVSISPN
jgi:hypothetical protein